MLHSQCTIPCYACTFSFYLKIIMSFAKMQFFLVYSILMASHSCYSFCFSIFFATVLFGFIVVWLILLQANFRKLQWSFLESSSVRAVSFHIQWLFAVPAKCFGNTFSWHKRKKFTKRPKIVVISYHTFEFMWAIHIQSHFMHRIKAV